MYCKIKAIVRASGRHHLIRWNVDFRTLRVMGSPQETLILRKLTRLKLGSQLTATGSHDV
jgi:hypothetical protein